MGLQSVFKSLAQAAFVAVGDIPVSVTYTHVTGNPTYTPATGTVTDSTTDYTVSVVFNQYKAADVDGANILSTDQQALIPVENLGCTPSNHDYMTVDGERWNVVDKETDPAEALWILQIRKP